MCKTQGLNKVPVLDLWDESVKPEAREYPHTWMINHISQSLVAFHCGTNTTYHKCLRHNDVLEYYHAERS